MKTEKTRNRIDEKLKFEIITYLKDCSGLPEYTVAEITDHLNVNWKLSLPKTTVYSWLSRHDLPYKKVKSTPKTKQELSLFPTHDIALILHDLYEKLNLEKPETLINLK